MIFIGSSTDDSCRLHRRAFARVYIEHLKEAPKNSRKDYPRKVVRQQNVKILFCGIGFKERMAIVGRNLSTQFDFGGEWVQERLNDDWATPCAICTGGRPHGIKLRIFGGGNFTIFGLLDDLKNRPLFIFRGNGTQNGPDGLGRLALLANYLSNVFLGHGEF